jgi:hypothetical protein
MRRSTKASPTWWRSWRGVVQRSFWSEVAGHRVPGYPTGTVAADAETQPTSRGQPVRRPTRCCADAHLSPPVIASGTTPAKPKCGTGLMPGSYGPVPARPLPENVMMVFVPLYVSLLDGLRNEL